MLHGRVFLEETDAALSLLESKFENGFRVTLVTSSLPARNALNLEQESPRGKGEGVPYKRRGKAKAMDILGPSCFELALGGSGRWMGNYNVPTYPTDHMIAGQPMADKN